MSWSIFLLFNCYLIFWIGIYYLFFRNKITFKFNRILLLSGIAISAFLPFIYVFAGHTSAEEANIALGIPTATVMSNSPSADGMNKLSIWRFIPLIYWLGVSISALIFTNKIIKVYRVIQKHEKIQHKRFVHVIIANSQNVFSFMHYIFGPKDIDNNIYRHELVHIKEKHALDNLLIEILKIFCWFNPGVYFYQKVIRMNHEYLADASATKQSDLTAYAKELINQSFKIGNLSIIQPFFNRSHLQKRLVMLQKNKQNKAKNWTYITLLPLLAGLIFLTSSFSVKENLDSALTPIQTEPLLSLFQDSDNINIEGVIKDGSGKPIPGVTIMVNNSKNGAITNNQGHFTLKAQPGQMLKITRIGYNPLTVTIPANSTELKFILYKKTKTLHNIVVTAYTNEPVSTEKSPISANGNHQKELSASSKKNTVFQFVEQMPHFRGGQKKLFQYLVKHIIYPKDAKEAQIQGTVMVQFIVSESGNLKNIKAVSQLGGGLEQEAIRVVKSMPQWIPGKQNGKNVAVSFNLPIRFQLKGPEIDTITPPPPPAPPAPKPKKQVFDPSKTYSFVEKMPQFKGGKDSLMSYLSRNIKYPKNAKENNIQGTIVVKFIVNKDGSISDVATTGEKKGGGLEQEAIRVVKSMPKWIPGEQDGKKVRVEYSLPIRFTLD